MSRGFPSMTALLGLLAVAGYQNRDKLGEILSNLGKGAPPVGGLGNLLSGLGSAGPGGLLNGGLKEIVDVFTANGQSDAVKSWVGKGPNTELSTDRLKTAIGPDVLATLTKQTGLSEDEIVSRLSFSLPETVDRFTLEGRLPS